MTWLRITLEGDPRVLASGPWPSRDRAERAAESYRAERPRRWTAELVDDMPVDFDLAFAARLTQAELDLELRRGYAELEVGAGVSVSVVKPAHVEIELLIPAAPHASRMTILSPDHADLLAEHLRIAARAARRTAKEAAGG